IAGVRILRETDVGHAEQKKTRERDVHCFSHNPSSLARTRMLLVCRFLGDSVSMPITLCCSPMADAAMTRRIKSGRNLHCFTFGLQCRDSGSLEYLVSRKLCRGVPVCGTLHQ